MKRSVPSARATIVGSKPRPGPLLGACSGVAPVGVLGVVCEVPAGLVTGGAVVASDMPRCCRMLVTTGRCPDDDPEPEDPFEPEEPDEVPEPFE